MGYLREIEINYRLSDVKCDFADGIITNSQSAVLVFHKLRLAAKEKFIVLNFGHQKNLLCFETVAVGSLASVSIRAMEVLRSAIVINAAGIVVMHNHPSGDPRPSQEDIEFTRKLKRLAEDPGLEFLDHIIMGLERHYSFQSDCFFDRVALY